MLINQPIPNLYGGVSQQPHIARFMNQLGSAVNCSADPVEGLKKRPPTEHVARIIPEVYAEGVGVFEIDRDPENRYVAVVRSGSLKVFDILTGAEKAVTGATNSYLTSDAPATSFRALTVADYTYIVNTDVQVQKTAARSPTRPYEALIWVRAGAYARTYSVFIDGNQQVSYKPPDGRDPEHAEFIDTDNLAETLVTGTPVGQSSYDEISGSLNGLAGFTVEREGSLIRLTSPTDFDIRVEDGQGQAGMIALKGSTSSLSDLPKEGWDDFTIKISQADNTEEDDYWVRYNGEVWQETLAPDVETSLDPTTLPHALIRDPDGTFRFEALPWVDRQVGDDDSAPFPSLVGLKLSALFYFRNRLGFLADENLVMSQAGDYFNLFRTTVTRVLDGDPIDTPVSDMSGENSPVSILEHAVAFDRKLVLFARNAQFIVGADRNLTPNTAVIDPVTSFQSSALCRPVAAGRFVYFAFDRDGASGVREFYVDGAAQTEDAIEVTSHCPTFLPANIIRMSSSTLENTLIALSSDTPNKLYVYNYFWSGEQKLQSAWGEWEFESSNVIRSCAFFDNVAYMVTERADGYHLERVRFRPNLVDSGLDYFTHLDSRVPSSALSMSYNPFSEVTEIAIPYQAVPGMELVTVKSATDLHAPGVRVATTEMAPFTLTVPGDVTAWDFVIGVPYAQTFELTRPYRVEAAPGGGTVADTRSALKIRDYDIDFASAGYFKAVFAPAHRDAVESLFSGKILGATALSIPDLEEGTFRIKTPCKNTHWSLQIINDSPFPSRFLAASWRGRIHSKSRRV